MNTRKRLAAMLEDDGDEKKKQKRARGRPKKQEGTKEPARNINASEVRGSGREGGAAGAGASVGAGAGDRACGWVRASIL